MILPSGYKLCGPTYKEDMSAMVSAPSASSEPAPPGPPPTGKPDLIKTVSVLAQAIHLGAAP